MRKEAGLRPPGARTCEQALQRPPSDRESALPTLSQSAQCGGQRRVHVSGGSEEDIPKPAGHAEQPKPSVQAPSAQFSSAQLRQISCTAQINTIYWNGHLKPGS